MSEATTGNPLNKAKPAGEKRIRRTIAMTVDVDGAKQAMAGRRLRGNWSQWIEILIAEDIRRFRKGVRRESS